jgi:hypothetical protein
MEKTVLELEVDSTGAVKGAQNLKTRIKEAQIEAQKMAESFGATSKQAVEAAKKAAGLKEELADIKQTIDALHPEAKFNAVIGLAQGIAGGFSAAQGAMALFGGESENVQKALLKVQAAMAISQGLNEINGLRDSFQNLGIVLKNTTVYTRAASLAQVAHSTVIGTSTGALKLFRLALAATGLGAFAVALGYVIFNWDDLRKKVDQNSESVKKWAAIFGALLFPAVAMIVGQYMLLKKGLDFVSERFDFVDKITGKVADKFGILTDKIKELLVSVGLLDSVEEERAQKNLEQSKVREDQIKRQIELAKAEGKSAQEIAALEVSLARERFLAYNQMIEAKRKAGRDISDEEKKQLGDLAFELKKSKIEEQKTIDDAAKKAQDQAKKDYEEKKKKADEYKKYLIDIQNKLSDEQINAIKDGHEKEIAQINKNFQDKLKAITGNSKAEQQLRLAYENDQAQQIQAVNDKYAQQNAQAAKDAINKSFDDKFALLESQAIDLETANKNTFDIQRQQAALRKNQSLLDDSLSEEQRKLVISKYNKEISSIDKAAATDRIKTEQMVRDAKLSLAQSTLNGLSNLAGLLTNNQKKQATINKAVAAGQLAIDEAKAIGGVVAGASEAAAATGPGAPFALPLFIAQGIVAITAPLLAAKKALSQSSSAINVAASGAGGSSGVQPQFNSAASPVTNLTKQQQPLEVTVNANVVETDMTRSQKRVNDIQKRASFP